MIAPDVLIALVISERPMVLARARRRLGSTHAEDATQVTMLRAIVLVREGELALPDDADVRSAVRRWLTGILHFVCMDFMYRSRLGWVRMLSEEPPPADPIAQLEAREQVRQAFYRLNKREREILSRVALGFTGPEIARDLGIPQGTAANNMKRVRDVLKKRRR